MYGKTSEKENPGLHELKEHKPWFDEEYLGFWGQKKRAKMQYVQDRSQTNADNLNNVRCDFNTHFRKTKV